MASSNNTTMDGIGVSSQPAPPPRLSTSDAATVGGLPISLLPRMEVAMPVSPAAGSGNNTTNIIYVSHTTTQHHHHHHFYAPGTPPLTPLPPPTDAPSILPTTPPTGTGSGATRRGSNRRGTGTLVPPSPTNNATTNNNNNGSGSDGHHVVMNVAPSPNPSPQQTSSGRARKFGSIPRTSSALASGRSSRRSRKGGEPDSPVLTEEEKKRRDMEIQLQRELVLAQEALAASEQREREERERNTAILNGTNGDNSGVGGMTSDESGDDSDFNRGTGGGAGRSNFGMIQRGRSGMRLKSALAADREGLHREVVRLSSMKKPKHGGTDDSKTTTAVSAATGFGSSDDDEDDIKDKSLTAAPAGGIGRLTKQRSRGLVRFFGSYRSSQGSDAGTGYNLDIVCCNRQYVPLPLHLTIVRLLP
jgi:hypothetical protein